MSETLKSCPFCGCDRIFERGFRCFDCPDCRAEGPPKATRAEAVAAWNTRSEPPADLKAAVEALAELERSFGHWSPPTPHQRASLNRLRASLQRKETVDE